MLTGNIQFSGLELVNHDRLEAYVGALLPRLKMDCGGCPTVTPDDPGPYTLPDTAGFEAPWYDGARPESAHFAGVFVSQITGFDDPYNLRPTYDGIVGGVLGGLRLGPLELNVTAQLYGASLMGLDYGLEWVTAVLAGKVCGADLVCNLGDLEYWATCPDPARGADCGGVTVVDETLLDLRRTAFSGGLVQGPRITNRLYDGQQVIAYEINFTITMELPWSTGTPATAFTGDIIANAAVAAETFTCPEFVDPCPPLTAAQLASIAEFSCPTFVEQTCDWNDPYETGPTSWLTQTWTATAEVDLTQGSEPCSLVLSRTGDALIHGCTRPSVRVSFATAAGGEGPVSIEFDVTAAQGNLNVQLWNPATDSNVAISGFVGPNGSESRVFTTPTGDAYNLLNTRSIGHHSVTFDVADGTDLSTLYMIITGFGGGTQANPATETLESITLNYVRPSTATQCCTLEPGVPIYERTYDIPCWTTPTDTHRSVFTVANTSLMNEAALRFVFQNTLGVDASNLRVAVYDPTLIGLAAGAAPTAAGVWPSGIGEWECNALVGEFFVPVIPAGQTLDFDGRRRQALTYPNGQPENPKSGDRWFYGGATKPWMFHPLPACTEWTVVVFADADSAAAGVTATVSTAALHLTAGAAA